MTDTAPDPAKPDPAAANPQAPIQGGPGQKPGQVPPPINVDAAKLEEAANKEGPKYLVPLIVVGVILVIVVSIIVAVVANSGSESDSTSEPATTLPTPTGLPTLTTARICAGFKALPAQGQQLLSSASTDIDSGSQTLSSVSTQALQAYIEKLRVLQAQAPADLADQIRAYSSVYDQLWAVKHGDLSGGIDTSSSTAAAQEIATSCATPHS